LDIPIEIRIMLCQDSYATMNQPSQLMWDNAHMRGDFIFIDEIPRSHKTCVGLLRGG